MEPGPLPIPRTWVFASAELLWEMGPHGVRFDRATFTEPLQCSEGIRYVLVNG